ncbi:class F sortase [Alteribacillus sp. HJP-4]|uniref:class F sortase n=1 Tax=Alteribacillus sp. HJP-4 TaxID=2775394 RepID=UPI0035CCF305
MQASSIESYTPAAVEIPAINVEAPIVAMGLREDGAMEVPDNGEETAWFEPGKAPGERGNAVIAGHVDDKQGPAVFFDLEHVDPGDEVIITDKNNTRQLFTITNKESFPYQEAPLEDIFGYSGKKQIKLITCTGEFDRDAGTHEDRLVITAELNK